MITCKKRFPVILIILLVLVGLGCSAGTLLVKAPVPTPTPTKTPRPIFTPTFIPSITPTPTDTPTITPIPLDTPTPLPEENSAEDGSDDSNEDSGDSGDSEADATPTEVPPTNTPAATNTAAPPPPPTNTPLPTNTPVPSYPYPSVLHKHPTGGSVEFRITGFVWEGDINSGFGEAQQGFVMEVITPSGATEVSEVSVGPKAGESTTRGAGDNHPMNFQYKHSGYTPGVYKVKLVKDGAQMSNIIEVVADAGPPYTYAHIDFIKQK